MPTSHWFHHYIKSYFEAIFEPIFLSNSFIFISQSEFIEILVKTIITCLYCFVSVSALTLLQAVICHIHHIQYRISVNSDPNQKIQTTILVFIYHQTSTKVSGPDNQIWICWRPILIWFPVYEHIHLTRPSAVSIILKLQPFKISISISSYWDHSVTEIENSCPYELKNTKFSFQLLILTKLEHDLFLIC